jgi:hypothetical protein
MLICCTFDCHSPVVELSQSVEDYMALRRVAAARQAISNLQGVVQEAVHVKIHPRPRNLAESREVLRILQKYGEVAVYKHLKVGIRPRTDHGGWAKAWRMYLDSLYGIVRKCCSSPQHRDCHLSECSICSETHQCESYQVRAAGWKIGSKPATAKSNWL